MAYGGRRGAGERVLESKHVIGLFLLMLLFSGVFFTLGYVMGRNQYDGQVCAATNWATKPEPAIMPKSEPTPRKGVEVPSPAAESDPATSTSNSDWTFYGNNKPGKSEPRLEPAARTPGVPPTSKKVSARGNVQPQPTSAPTPSKTSRVAMNAPVMPNGTIILQVAALVRQDDALAIASSLQKKHYAAYVQTPTKDKYYRVQVGPFRDQKAADEAKKGLEDEGFKAFYVKH
ncbi:MAG: SPOR domain-containing protein [Candidatus Acidiferrum sp.]